MKNIDVELGYWRKHPDLHGYIVRQFNDGDDDCREIELDVDAINQIMITIMAEQLPHTEGFFFGGSPSKKNESAQTEIDEQKEADLKIFKAALEWVQQEGEERREWRSIAYCASW